MSNFINRELVQRVSRTAALMDRVLSGEPVERTRHVDYDQRQRMQESQARRELRELRDRLNGMELGA